MSILDNYRDALNFCNRCGGKISTSVSNKNKSVAGICIDCNAVYYDNPKIIVLSLIDYQGKVLLCKRAIKPKLGYWALPGGYMERNETIEGAAIRETREETGVNVKNLHLYTLVNCPKINQVYFILRGSVDNDHTEIGEESLDVNFYAECDIPWENLSYKLMNQILDWFYEDIANGKFVFRTYDTHEICPE